MTKIAWKKVCLPRSEGGLGLRRFADWNKNLCLRFIWTLFSEKESLWALWHKHHTMRGQSFWALTKKSRDSWTWNFLLQLRPSAATFIKGILGNGSKLSFWYDNWTPLGPLILLLGDAGPSHLRIPLLSNVAAATIGENWNLPNPRCEGAVALQAYLSTVIPIQDATAQDSYIWEVDGVDCHGFSTKKTWNYCRPKEEKKGWAKQVWFKGAVSKNAFHMWLANLNRLPTKTRLSAWGLNIQTTCSLCTRDVETRDHLFLMCSFSTAIWKSIFLNLKKRRPMFQNWAELLSWVRRGTIESPSLLRKLVTQSVLKHIWTQRNEVIHNQIYQPPEVIFDGIYKEVKTTISARSHRQRFSGFMSLWIR